jgi:hypothetical protein
MSVQLTDSNQIYKKYLKYKTKYLAVNKHMIGGVIPPVASASAACIDNLSDEILPIMFAHLDLNGLMSLRKVNAHYNTRINYYLENHYIKKQLYLSRLNDIFILCKNPKYRDIIIEQDKKKNYFKIFIEYEINKIIGRFNNENNFEGGPFSVNDVFTKHKPIFRIILKVHNIKPTVHEKNGRTFITSIYNTGGLDNSGYSTDRYIQLDNLPHNNTATTRPIMPDQFYNELIMKIYRDEHDKSLPQLLEEIDNISLELHKETYENPQTLMPVDELLLKLF